LPLHRERLGLLDKEVQQKVLDQKRKLLVRDMTICFSTIEGRRVLRYLMNICGPNKGKIGGNPQLGMDVLQGTFYNSCREQIWIEFKEFIPANILQKAEYGDMDELEGD